MVRGRDRYVSKAILCVLRMQYLRKIFPDARFLLYVRNPIDHIASITKQDRIWAELEKSDPRQIEIIELTGHHEFGTAPGDGERRRPRRAPHEFARLFDEGRWAESRGRYWAYVYGFRRQTAGERSRARAPRLGRALRRSLHDSLATIDRILAHTQLDAPSFAESRTKYGEKLSFPDYYKPKFEPEVLEAIVASTSDVAKHFNYDVAAIAGKVGAPTT